MRNIFYKDYLLFALHASELATMAENANIKA